MAIILKNEYLNLKPFARLSGLCGIRNNPWLSLEFTNVSKDPNSAVVKADFLFSGSFCQTQFLSYGIRTQTSHSLVNIYLKLFSTTKLTKTWKGMLFVQCIHAARRKETWWHLARWFTFFKKGKISSSQVFVWPWYCEWSRAVVLKVTSLD